VLLAHAAALEQERDHVLGRPPGDGTWTEEDTLVAAALAERTTPDLYDEQPAFEALESEATFDRVLFDGGEFGTGLAPGTPEEEDFLGIPGLLDADQVTDLLRTHQNRSARATVAPVPTARDVPALRRELNDCVRGYARQAGVTQATVHNELRRACGGPETARAGAEELRARIERLRQWATSPRSRGR
jgi:hypothetical protein